MNSYTLTDSSQKDLIQIRRFTLKHWGSKQSIRYLKNLRKTLDLIAEMPSIGKNCFEDFGKDVYCFLFQRHAIYYLMMSKDKIVILNILHQNMLPEKHLMIRV